jgi:hypothetical protein
MQTSANSQRLPSNTQVQTIAPSTVVSVATWHRTASVTPALTVGTADTATPLVTSRTGRTLLPCFRGRTHDPRRLAQDAQAPSLPSLRAGTLPLSRS